MAPENQIPFYARWTGRFLRFSNVHQDKPVDLRMEMFLDALKKDKKLQEWQISQADNAVTVYIHHFLPEAGDISHLSPNAGAISLSLSNFEKYNISIRHRPQHDCNQ